MRGRQHRICPECERITLDGYCHWCGAETCTARELRIKAERASRYRHTVTAGRYRALAEKLEVRT